MRLLVVDDEPGIVTFIAIAATKLGWTVEQANDVPTFQRNFQATAPDLVMLDLQLGTADGIEQLRFLRDRGYGGQIVLMSGFDRRVLEAAQEIGKSLGLSVVALLMKPSRGAELRNVLMTAARSLETGKFRSTATPPADEPVPAASAVGTLSSRDVDRALGDGTMSLHLQAVVSASSSQVIRFEALSRWSHPTFGMVSPDQFVALAEQDEMVIDRLTMWVVAQAIAHHRQLADAQISVPISINISARNIQRLDFPDRVASLTTEKGVGADALILEVTESAAMGNAASTTDVLARLRLKGFKLAMDDFGTGYSSLKALRQLPFSELKIDKSFVLDMTQSHDSFVIVKSVIDLARNMGLETVAEGVETSEVVEQLVDLGVSGLQGFYFARPLPIEQALEQALRLTAERR